MRIRALVLIVLMGAGVAVAAPPTKTPADPKSQDARDIAALKAPLLQLGPGDSVAVQVYGQPDLNSTVYVSDDGTIPIALAGAVKVAGLSRPRPAAELRRPCATGNSRSTRTSR